MAERSKAPVSGTGLFGGVGSNYRCQRAGVLREPEFGEYLPESKSSWKIFLSQNLSRKKFLPEGFFRKKSSCGAGTQLPEQDILGIKVPKNQFFSRNIFPSRGIYIADCH